MVEQPAEAAGDAEHLARPGEWRRMSPFALLHFLGVGLKGLVANAGQLAASIGTLALLSREGLTTMLVGAAGLLALFTTIAGLRWWFFRCALDADSVRIRQGVLKKTELNVQFERIQGVNIEQPLTFRLLRLVTVGFDTAGSAGQEGKLPAVTPQFAAALRARIERERRARAASMPAPDYSASASPSAAAGGERATAGGDAAKNAERVVRLAAGEMVRIGLADRSVLAGIAFVPLAWQAFDDTLREGIETRLRDLAADFQELGMLAASLMVAGGLALTLVLVLTITIASAFLRYHDFTLFAAAENRRFRSVRGLLTRKETAVERTKIQQLRLTQGLLFRWFGRFHLRMLPAASATAASAGGAQGAHSIADSMLHVPALASCAVRPLAARIFAEEGERLSLLPTTDPFVRVAPAYIEARCKVVGMAPAVLATALLYPFFGAISLWCLAWAPLTGLVVWQLWRQRGYMHTDDGLALRRGFLGFKVDAFLFRKVQTVAMRRSPLQRRRGLASLDVVLASGVATVPYIDHAAARRLRDYMLYKAESDHRPWH